MLDCQEARNFVETQDHLTREELQRFMTGGLAREEARKVVRRLLVGCAVCFSVTRRIWNLCEQPLWYGRRVRKGSRNVSGVEIIRFDALVSCAIAAPLELWCLRLYLRTTGDDEADLQRLLHEAPWLRDSLDLAGVIVEELQRHRYAILACNTEALARGLAEASRPERRFRARRLHVQIYSPLGLCIGQGDGSPV